MPLADTANVSEVLWTAISLIVLLVNIGLTWNAWRDHAALIRVGGNGARKIAARTAIGTQLGLTLPQLIAVVVGVVALLTPNAEVPFTRSGAIVRGGLILTRVILLAVAIYTHIGRRVLLNYLDRTEESAGATRHAETMTELVHNTEVTTEARDGAQEAYHIADSMNEKIIVVQQEIAATNEAAGDAATAAKESTDKLRDLMQKLEGERVDRAADEKGGC